MHTWESDVNITPDAQKSRLVVKFNRPTRYNIIEISAYYGSCFITCNESVLNHCDYKYLSAVNLSHDNSSFTFENAPPGNYCVRLTPKDDICSQQQNCNVVFSNTVQLEAPCNDDCQNLSLIDPGNNFVLCAAVAVMCALIIAIMIVMCLIKQSYLDSSDVCTSSTVIKPGTNESIALKMFLEKCSRKPKVLLLYSRRSKYLNEVVADFRKLLEKLQFEVIDYFDSRYSNIVMNDITEWVKRMVYNPEIKVLFILPENSVFCQTEQGQCQELQSLDTVFTVAFKFLQNDSKLRSDCNHTLIARFNYLTDMRLISIVTPYQCFTLMDHFLELFCRMHNLNKLEIDKDELCGICKSEINILEASITKVKNILNYQENTSGRKKWDPSEESCLPLNLENKLENSL